MARSSDHEILDQLMDAFEDAPFDVIEDQSEQAILSPMQKIASMMAEPDTNQMKNIHGTL